MPKQSRRMSFIEACCNVAIGYAVAVAANVVVLPWFGYPVTFSDAAGIGLAFTAIALARSYAVRRLFERRRPAPKIDPSPLFVTIRCPGNHHELVIGRGGGECDVTPLSKSQLERLALESVTAILSR